MEETEILLFHSLLRMEDKNISPEKNICIS